jgi:hypothetical protein
MRIDPSSTSTRTFLLVPLAALAERLLRRRRRFDRRWAPLLVWGYLQYRIVGDRRVSEAGGPRGMSQGFPERLVTDGVYARVRNPMYLGHLIYLSGLTLVTRSPVAGGYLLGAIPWFNARAAADEVRLQERFGAEYDAYRAAVPRWLPRIGRRRDGGAPAA